MRSLVLTALLATTVAGCTVQGPSVRVDPIPVIHVEGAGGPSHCPPGQAKKGRC